MLEISVKKMLGVFVSIHCCYINIRKQAAGGATFTAAEEDHYHFTAKSHCRRVIKITSQPRNGLLMKGREGGGIKRWRRSLRSSGTRE